MWNVAFMAEEYQPVIRKERDGVMPNGTKLSLLSMIFPPVFYLLHFMPRCR